MEEIECPICKKTPTTCYTVCVDCFEKLQADNERLTKALERLSRWAKAYPLETFPEPNFVIAREVLEEHGISLDSVSASNMRHVIKGVSDIVEQALEK